MISVYLDNCCYNRPYDDQEQPRIYLETQAVMCVKDMITKKKIKLVYSFVSEYEANNNPHDSRKTAIFDFFRNADVFVGKPQMAEVVAIASEIMKTGIKQMDALHVASAIVGGADYFLSTDKRLLKYQSEKIKLINPINFIQDMEVLL